MSLAPLEFTGERYVPTEPGQIRLEHLHRYAWCRGLVVGKDVLDLASGEGYGSRMLAAAGASSVVGVDVSSDAVAYAAQAYADTPSLRFLCGDAAAVPLPDRSVDVVVSFETIEHHDRHDEMLAEIRRVLRPGGLLVISSPNRPVYDAQNPDGNEFHVKELDRDELLVLLGRYFAHVRLFGQRLALGTAIYPLEVQEAAPRFDALTDLSDGVAPRTPCLPEPVYFIAVAVCEAQVLPATSPSLLLSEREDLVAQHRAVARWAQSTDRQLTSTRAQLGALVQQHETVASWAKGMERDLAQQRQQTEGNRDQIERLEGELQAERGRLAALVLDQGAMTQRARGLERDLAEQREQAQQCCNADVERLEDELRAERAQIEKMRRTRSWRYTRPLHEARVAVRDGWKALRRRWKSPRTPAPPAAPPAPAYDPERVLAGLRFPVPAVPKVSIIIPCYGQFAITAACLRSIQQHLPAAPIEVLVVEDASADREIDHLAAVPGLRYMRHPYNLGFLRSCNDATRHARGEYLHFLNNDTEVTAGWLDTMLELFATRADCGLVGSRLLFPDGLQQEAGGIVWDDASAWNYGRGDNPQRSVYGYVRRADYCSAASVLLRADVFRELGGFDERYLPAYYEDTDLAFRVRARGLEVYYQPESRVVHHEGVSHGTDLNAGIKAHQLRNQGTFRARWEPTLRNEHFANGKELMLARDRGGTRPILLVVDHYVPQPDRDAGSRCIAQLIETYLDMGWIVKFWPDNLYHDPRYTRALQQMGVEVFYGAEYVGRFGAWMKENGRHIDRVLLSRPHVAVHYFDDIRAHSTATVMYYGHDLHHLRLAEQRRQQPEDRQLALEEAKWRTLEEKAWDAADVVYYLSHEEVDYVAAQVARRQGTARVLVAQPYFYEQIADPQADDLDGRCDVLFVAGFAHAPNVDAALWFCREVLPALLAQEPALVVWLVGSNPTPAVQALAGPHVRVTGYVSESRLRQHYANARVAVAPMRFGAGVKNKVVEAAAYGCPLVTTSVGYQGLQDLAAASPPADCAADFVARTLLLLRDDEAWRRARRLGAEFVRGNFSRASMRASLTLETETATT